MFNIIYNELERVRNKYKHVMTIVKVFFILPLLLLFYNFQEREKEKGFCLIMTYSLFLKNNIPEMLRKFNKQQTMFSNL